MSVEIGKMEWSTRLKTPTVTLITRTQQIAYIVKEKRILIIIIMLLLYYNTHVQSESQSFQISHSHKKTHQRNSKISAIYRRPINTFLWDYIHT